MKKSLLSILTVMVEHLICNRVFTVALYFLSKHLSNQ